MSSNAASPPSRPAWVRPALTALAIGYLAFTWLDAAGSNVARRALPGTLVYFVQTARLFPTAAHATIDYRLEGWDCEAQRFVELDPSIDFPINANNKESRYYRTAHFFRQDRTVMRALEGFVVRRANERAAHRRFGGIRVSSLRFPIAPKGGDMPRWTSPPLESVPEDQRHAFYFTANSARHSLCEGKTPAGYDRSEGSASERGSSAEEP